jgi:hypothetical protein
MLVTTMFMDFTIVEAITVACAVVEISVIFALLRYVPKTPATGRLNAIATTLSFIVIAATT